MGIGGNSDYFIPLYGVQTYNKSAHILFIIIQATVHAGIDGEIVQAPTFLAPSAQELIIFDAVRFLRRQIHTFCRGPALVISAARSVHFS